MLNTTDCNFLITKNILNGQNTFFAIMSPSGENKEYKHTHFLTNKDLRAQRSIKNAILTNFWGVKGPISIAFLEKRNILLPTL